MENINNENEVTGLIAKFLQQDAQLPSDIQYINNETPRKNTQHILLTGVTGIIGPYLLYALLKNTHATVHCLVRKMDNEDSKNRIMNALTKYHLLENADTTRIKVIEGDIVESQLGVSDETYEWLARNIDMIFHNAAWTNHIRPYTWPHSPEKNDIRETNTLSLIKILKLAGAIKTKYVNFVSTVAAINRFNFEGDLIEELPSIDQESDGIFLGYPQSKFVAEKLLQQAIVRGLPARIFRLGQITGDSTTGMQLAENDHMMLEVKACAQLGYAPDSNNGRSFLPIDIAADIISALSFDEHIANSAYNIINPNFISWHDIINLLNKRGYSIKFISEKSWIEKILQVDEANALYRFKSAYSKMGGLENLMPSMGKVFQRKIKIDKTVQALENYSIRFPTGEALWEKYLDYFIRIKFFDA